MTVSKLKVKNTVLDIKDTTARTNIGDPTNLTTVSKTNTVSAINETSSLVNTVIGNDTGKSMREVAQEVAATVYTPQGSIASSEIPSLSSDNIKVGWVYNITDSFTTTNDFIEGAGILVGAGTNIVVCNSGGTKKWDLLGQTVDLSPYQQKALTTAVTVDGTSRTTVESAIEALNNYTDKKGEQYSIMPTASISLVDKIVQYTGTTTSTYSNGKFYKCVLNTTNNEYEWEEIAFAASIAYDSNDFSNDNSTLSLLPQRRIFTGTSQEWDQLSSAEKAKYTLVCITDDSGIDLSTYINEYTDDTPSDNSTRLITSGGVKAYVDQATHYSTSETLTGGTWIDGSPIYRKAGYMATVAKSTRVLLDSTLTMSNVKHLIASGGSLQLDDGYVAVGAYVYVSGVSGLKTTRIALQVRSDGLYLLSITSDNAISNLYWWIEYVKK